MKMGMSDLNDEDEEQGLIKKDGDNGGGDDDDFEMPPEPEAKGPLKPVSEITKTEILAAAAGGTAVGAAIANIVMVGGMWVIIAGGLSTLMGGYLYYQTNKLVDIRTFTEVIAYIQNQVELIKKHNEELDAVIGGLGTNLEKLGDLKNTLDTLQSLGGESIDEFKENVEKSKANCRKRGQQLSSQLVRIIWDLMETADKDRDYVLSRDEVEYLLSMLREINGVVFFEDRIRAALSGKPIDTCEDLILNLHDDKAPKDQILFDMNII